MRGLLVLAEWPHTAAQRNVVSNLVISRSVIYQVAWQPSVEMEVSCVLCYYALSAFLLLRAKIPMLRDFVRPERLVHSNLLESGFTRLGIAYFGDLAERS